MKSRLALILVFVLSGRSMAQPAAPVRPPLETLLSEVRLLRQAIERQTVAMTRAHILVARYSSQEQRLIRARVLLESLESKISDARTEEDRLRTDIERVEAALDDPARAGVRKEIEGELRRMQDGLKSVERSLSDLQARRAVAEQSAESERLRLEETERALLTEALPSSKNEGPSA